VIELSGKNSRVQPVKHAIEIAAVTMSSILAQTRSRFLILTFAAILSLFWLRDIVRLSSLHETNNPSGDSSIRRWNTKPVLRPPPADGEDSKDKNPCDRWPQEWLDRVQVVLKTGAAEDPNRLQTWLTSVGRCIGNILIVSDHAGKIGEHQIHDVLAMLPDAYSDFESNPDFALYEEQKRLIAEGSLEEHNTEAGWRLDRYKFLPMVSFARQMRPNAGWYFFIESDSYVSWDNLYRFLGQFDPEKALYIGSPLHGATDESWFAYGGSGIALSGAAVSKLLTRKTADDGSYKEPEIYERRFWIETLKNDTYGESVLGAALRAADVGLSGFYPMLYPLNLASIPFGDPQDGGFWCEPVITMHKLWSGAEYEGLWEWEMARDNRKVRFIRQRPPCFLPDPSIYPEPPCRAGRCFPSRRPPMSVCDPSDLSTRLKQSPSFSLNPWTWCRKTSDGWKSRGRHRPPARAMLQDKHVKEV
jgi:Fringe-like